jgi:hypothetical protein
MSSNASDISYKAAGAVPTSQQLNGSYSNSSDNLFYFIFSNLCFTGLYNLRNENR